MDMPLTRLVQKLSFFHPFIIDKKPVLKFSDYNQNVKVAFFKSYKNILIELIQPMNKKSPINNF